MYDLSTEIGKTVLVFDMPTFILSTSAIRPLLFFGHSNMFDQQAHQDLLRVGPCKAERDVNLNRVQELVQHAGAAADLACCSIL
jgi:hypothetical protein